MTHSEELSKAKLQAFARKVRAAAFPGHPYPNELLVHVARGFYLPDSEVPNDLAPMILCPPSNRMELVRTICHELVHHKIGYGKHYSLERAIEICLDANINGVNAAIVPVARK